MNFLKSLLYWVVDLVARPFIALKDIRTMSAGAVVYNLVQAGARIAIAASYFVTMPALAVSVAWWVVLLPFYIAVASLFLSMVMVLGAAIAAYGFATSKEKTDTAAVEPTLDDVAPVSVA
jgi:hypothetical protein